MEAAAEASTKVKHVFEQMSDPQRKLFVSLAQGDDALVAAIKGGYDSWYRGIIKVVYRRGHIAQETKSLNLSHLPNLEEESYERLLRVCEAKAKDISGGADITQYLPEIQDFFKLVAPEAFAVVNEIMTDVKVSPSVRLKAATDVLNRAGYSETKKASEDNSPVKLVFNFGGPESEAIVVE